ncbi:MAG TPA: amylo-alpha-1,6-glucosidase [Anaerolineales bacterium]
MPDFEPLHFPEMRTSSLAIDRAYRIALGDLIGNVRNFRDGLLEEPQPVLLAGLDYDTPWTRDAAINIWNGLGLFWRGVSRSTLLAVLERKQNKLYIGGQYWDAIIWTLGAWAYYLCTGDRELLTLAFDAVKNSLAHFELEEFDARLGLFRGPAVYGDGVSAYPDRYSPGGTSSILDWAKANPGKKARNGFGIPMVAFSTNCVYVQAYRIASMMSRELSMGSNTIYEERAAVLADRIQQHFWNVEKGTFDYIIDPEGICDFQEGLGHAFAILFGLTSDEQAGSVLAKQHATPAGIPCVWPTFPRYAALGGFGRHSGTVWPFISGFWGEAALKHGRPDLFEHEFTILTANINRDGQCAEIYHPLTGEIYGGLQEGGSGPHGMQWVSCARQSWTASSYLRILLTGLFGMQFSTEGITFQPYLPAGTERAQISGILYRACKLDLTVEGRGGRVVEFHRNGTPTQPFLPADLHGEQRIRLRMAE